MYPNIPWLRKRKKMAKINFYLKGAKSKLNLERLKNENKSALEFYLSKPLPLVLYCSLKGKRIPIPMNCSIPPKYWDIKNNKVKSLTDTPLEMIRFNDKITATATLLSEHFTDFERRGKRISRESMLSALRGEYLDNSQEVWCNSIEATFSHFLIHHKNYSGFSLEHSTVKKYKTIKRNLIRFTNKYYPSFEWLDIDTSFFRNFQDFVYDELGNLDNTATKYIKGIKCVLRHLMEAKFKINVSALTFKVREYEAPAIIVELKELRTLYQWDFKDENLSQVRDLFVFMAWTGQRFSDIKTINRNAITKVNGQDVWLVTTKKTNDTSITVPLNEYCKEILERYHYLTTAIPVFTEQHFNKSLKEMAEKVGLSRLVRRITWKRGKPCQHSLPLYEVLSSHIARKTFITNSLILGMSESEVKKISGHKDDRSFRRYVEMGNSYLSKAKDKLSKDKVDAMINMLEGN